MVAHGGQPLIESNTLEIIGMTIVPYDVRIPQTFIADIRGIYVPSGAKAL